MLVYVTGSLEGAGTPQVAEHLRAEHEVFDDWYAAGPRADYAWQEYEQRRGHSMRDALAGRAARHVYDFDKHWLHQSEAVVLVAPAGKSAHIEAMWALSEGKRVVVYFDEDPPKWDVMYLLMLESGARIVYGIDELKEALR
jgi:hypothetical protein